MRKTYRVLGYLIAAMVVVQAMAIGYALSGLNHWVAEDGGVYNKQLTESKEAPFIEGFGFAVHALNGMMLIPLLALLFLIVSFFAKVPQGSRRAGAVLGLVVLQVMLGFTAHSLPAAALLHVLNAFAILVVAFTSARRAGAPIVPVATSVETRTSVSS